MKPNTMGVIGFLVVVILMLSVHACDAYEDQSIKRDRVLNSNHCSMFCGGE